MLTAQGSQSLAFRISISVVEYHVRSTINIILSTTTRFLVLTLPHLRTMRTAWPRWVQTICHYAPQMNSALNFSDIGHCMMQCSIQAMSLENWESGRNRVGND